MNQSKIDGFLGLMGRVEARAKVIDLAAIPSKAEEMHRLMDDACNALVAVLAFCEKIGVTPKSDQFFRTVLSSMCRDGAGKRFVDGVWNGTCTSIDVSNLDFVDAARIAYANQIGVSEQDVIRFEKMEADYGRFSRFISVDCNASGCSMSKGICFNTPVEMLLAEQRAAKEVWYCHHHREAAFTSQGVLSDEMLPILRRIAQSPGLAQNATGAKKEELSFLEAIGLVRVEQITHGNRVMRYQIFITESGQAVLDSPAITGREE